MTKVKKEKKVKKKKDDFVDDGRVIAPMNVDGMKWYVPPSVKKEREEASEKYENLTKKERRAFTNGALAAGLVIGLVFIAAFAATIGILLWVWN